MIKVLHCVSNMDRAGIETMLMNYYRNIDRENIQFYFLCNKNKPGAYDEEILDLGGKIFHSPGLNPLKALKYHKIVKRIIIENNIDIVHVHNGAFGLQALIAAKSAGVKVRISHVHGTKIDKNLKLPLKLLYKTQLKRFANQYWGCGIEAVNYYFGKNNIDKENYYILKNAIDEEKFKYNSEIRKKIRQKLNIKENEILVGHVGRFMPQKNHIFLIDVFKNVLGKNKNYKLLLMGDGELQEKIKNKVTELGMKDKVIFTGNVPNTYEYYQAMDLFILPSLFEGLPVVGIEAQASGLNCLFSDTISKEVDITGNVEYLSLNDSLDKWGDKIIEISFQKRKTIEKEIYNSGYSIKVETKKLEEKYEDLLKR